MMKTFESYSGQDKDEISRPSKRQARFQTLPEELDASDNVPNIHTCPSRTNNTEFLDFSSEADNEIALFGLNIESKADDINPDHVDSLLAREMTLLSMADREQVYYDLHGVSSGIDETPELIQESLNGLQKEISSISDAVAYKKALEMDPAYVENTKLRLRFLRTERFDIRLTALRFIKFFEKKLELFGPELLVKEISQEDLNEDDIAALYDGTALDLPFRDRAGRLILFTMAQPLDVSIRAVLRKTFYGNMLFSEDEETQKNGVVIISYIVGQQLTWQQVAQRQKMNREWGSLLSGLPIRVEAMHLCADSVMWRPIFAIFKFAASMWTRVRVREHLGTHQEVQFSLQTYGIPVSQGFPVTESGEVLRHMCKERWKKRHSLEQILKQAATHRVEGAKEEESAGRELVRVGTPGQDDVLLGRGKAFYNHVGNVRLRNIVIERVHLYEGAGISGKQKVSDEIIDLIKAQFGRFLKDDGAGWVEVDDLTARKKVSHAFRTFRVLRNNGGKFPSKNPKRRKDDDDDE